MGLRTVIRTPIATTTLGLETMSVDELVNIIKEEEGLIVDDNDVDLALHLDNNAIGEHNNSHIDDFKDHIIEQDTNDDNEDGCENEPPENEKEKDDDENEGDEEYEDEDEDEYDEIDENDQAQNPYHLKGQLIPPPYFSYPYHYPHVPPPGYAPPPIHQPHVDYNMYTGSQNPHVYTDASTMTDPAPDTRRNRGGVTEPFPEKLHRMLDAAEREGLSDVVSFFSHGRAFAIHKPRRFVSEVMHRFFRQTRLTSFQRQLNLYGFRRISTGPDNGGYYHELFLKGRPGLCVNMKRTKVKGASKLKRDPDTEPNFYAMRPITTGGGNSPLAGTTPIYGTYPPYYPPPPSYPPYTAAQNGSIPQPPPGYPPYPPPPYFHPYWAFGMPLPLPMQQPQQHSRKTPRSDIIQPQQKKKAKKDSGIDNSENKSKLSLADIEIPPSPLPEVTEEV